MPAPKDAAAVAAAADAFNLLEARHVDNLTASVRTLSQHISVLTTLQQKAADHARLQLQAVTDLSTTTADLAVAVRELAQLLKDARGESEITPSGRRKDG